MIGPNKPQRYPRRGRPVSAQNGVVNVVIQMPIEFAGWCEDRGYSCAAMARKLLHEAMEREPGNTHIQLPK